MRSRRSLQVLLAAIAAMVVGAQLFPGTSSSFTDTTSDSGNTVTAATDWTAPTISATVLQKALGGATGKIGQGDAFYVYANAADSGNPSSGLGTVTAAVANISATASAAMTAGSWTVGGTTYDHRTAQLTAKATLASGTYAYSISASDAAGNGPATLTGSVAVDNTAFAPSSLVIANGGTTAGRAEKGDTIAMTYNKAPDPDSVISGWDGSSTSINVALADGRVYGTGSSPDMIGPVDANGSSIGIGYAALGGGDYVSNGKTVTFTGSTIVLSGSTLTITLGTPDVPTSLLTDTTSHAAAWSSLTTVYDGFGNPSTGATITGASRVQF